ncbi:MAG: Gfo/Idh/MocA family protein, partial [Polyangiales bacterium]
MSKETNVAIVGAGYIADYHMSALRALPDVKVVAVCDLKESAAQRFATAYGINGVYSDLSAMLAQENLDAVHVLTPPHTHVQPGITILEA